MGLIYSEELIDRLPIIKEDKQISLIGAVADMITMISKCQTVDAVEVVRCGNCKHFDLWSDGRSMCHCSKHDRQVNGSDYCSDGEKGEERNDR